MNKIGRAPAPVAKPAARLAMEPNHTISVLKANQPIFSPNKPIGHVKKREWGFNLLNCFLCHSICLNLAVYGPSPGVLRLKCPEGLPSKSSWNHASCSISSWSIASDKS